MQTSLPIMRDLGKPGADQTMKILLGTAAIALALAPRIAAAQSFDTDGCALENGSLAAGCANPNAGMVVVRDGVPNTEAPEIGALGADGFAITLEPLPRESSAAPAGTERAADRALDEAGINVSLDGMDVRPRLAIATDTLRSTARAGEAVTFRASTNYSSWIKTSEIRIADKSNPGRLIATVPVAPNGTATWAMPAEGPADLVYSLRVYDSQGRYNETRLSPLTRTDKAMASAELSGPIAAAGEGEDMTARAAIPIRGGAVTVSGTAPEAARVMAMGEDVPVDGSGSYAIQRILPPGQHVLDVQVGATHVSRTVEVPVRDWFYVGMADITVGTRDDGADGTYSLGRFAGYAKGHTASGYTITASVDTREGELEDVFRDLGEKNPDRVLNRIKSEDVYPTFGDDSTTFNDAPTSGKFYLRIEKERSYLSWGDFEPEKGPTDLIRSDRTLYGAKGYYESQDQTSFGEPRARVTAYAADPDRLAQRDVLHGTGGSAYFLSRQDVLEGTETVYVEYRDKVTGHVIDRRRLAYGTDYEIDYFQGVIILTRPLSSSAGSSFLSGGAAGRYDQAVVVQYEYVPTTGSVDGYSYGGRGETWVNDHLRLGISGSKDTTGLSDNTVAGGDVRLRASENTWLQLEYAQSEGPGFGQDESFTGGLDLFSPGGGGSAGVRGLKANAYRVEGQADLAEVTGGRVSGTMSGYYDHKDKGFVSADYDIAADEDSWGLALDADLSPSARLQFSHDQIRVSGGEKSRESRATFAYDVNAHTTVEFGASDRDRRVPGAYAGYNGGRTDVGAKVIWTRDDDMKLWAFGQGSVRSSGGIDRNNRAGIGAEMQITDRLSLSGEASGGNLGAAADVALNWNNGQGRTYHVGYQIDPDRTLDHNPLIRDNQGAWVIGATAQVNDKLSYTTENRIALAGRDGSMTNAYGVRYSPTDKWTYGLDLTYGEDEDPVYQRLRRQGISGSVSYADGDQLNGSLKLEYLNQDATTGITSRDTWLMSGYLNYRTSEDWRLLANVDALISDSDGLSFRDGRYVDADIGYAYRPADNNRLTALVKYSYLYDMPGPDQVNYDGNLNGPRQKSHIFSIDVNYDLNERWTIGGKYGLRFGDIEDRLTGLTQTSRADLAILRLDYAVALKWDMMAEGRIFREHETDIEERAFLAGIYRNFGDNLKVGVGYQWGEASDDLKSLDQDNSGVFLNVVGKF